MNAALGMIPGVISTPSGEGLTGISVFGLGPAQNGFTLNGSAFTGVTLPRDGLLHQVRLSTYDPKFGGYTGLQVAASLWCGCRNPPQTLHATADDPLLQWSTPAATRLGTQYRNQIVSGNIAGNLASDSSYYSVAYQVGRRTTELPTLFGLTQSSLVSLGMSPDSIDRLRSVASSVGLPLGPQRPLAAVTTSASVIARADFTPGAAEIIGAISPTLYVLVSGAVSHTRGLGVGTTTSALRESDVERQDGQLMLTYAPYLFDALNETKASISLSRTVTRPVSHLPMADVHLFSNVASAPGRVVSLQLGGSGGANASDHRATWQLTNETSWMTRDGGHKFQVFGDVALTQFAVDNAVNPLGRFVFNSLSDIAAGRAASYSRSFGGQRGQGSVVQAALGLSDVVKFGTEAKASGLPRGDGLTLQYGARLESQHFNDRPALNPLVLSTLGRRNDVVPSVVSVSPMLGFTWNTGTFREDVADGGWYQADRHLVTGGVRQYLGALPPLSVYQASQQTGLPAALQTLQCIGAASPSPDWTAYTNNTGAVPNACLDGSSAGLVQSSPPVALFSPSFAAPRSWRAEVNWRVRASGRLYVVAGSSYSLNLGAVERYDLNFDGRPKFLLAGEGGRPVYVPSSAIDVGSGAMSSTGSRQIAALGPVSEIRSDLRSEQYQAVVGVEYHIRRTVASSKAQPDPSPFSGTFRVNYVNAGGRAQLSGFNGSTAGDPRVAEWGASAYPERTVQAVFTGQLDRWFSISASARLSSGFRYTPLVANDINADGYVNDRAFVFDPMSTADPSIGTGMRTLLTEGPSSARKCLNEQLGRIAATNSCVGQWSAALGTISLTMDSYRIGLGNRGSLSFYLNNVLGGIDQVLHGASRLHGWGQGAYPDPVLLHLRGFDPAGGRFIYAVNPQFGSSAISQLAYRHPVRLTVDFRVDVGRDPETQAIEQSMKTAERYGYDGSASKLTEFFILLAQPRAFNLENILRVKDSLGLSVGQTGEILVLQKRHRAVSDSIFAGLAAYLFGRQGNYSGEATRQVWHDAISRVVRSSVTATEGARALLSSEQLDWLRSRRLAPTLFYSSNWLERTLRGPLSPR